MAWRILNRAESLFRLVRADGKPMLPPYPYPLGELTWLTVEAASRTVIESGNAWKGLCWLCLSICQTDETYSFYTDLAEALRACADFAADDASWKDRELIEITDSMGLMAEALRCMLRSAHYKLGKDKARAMLNLQADALSACVRETLRLEKELAKKSVSEPELAALSKWFEESEEASQGVASAAAAAETSDSQATDGAVQAAESASAAAARSAESVSQSATTLPAAGNRAAAQPAPKVSTAGVSPPAATSWVLPSQQPGGPANPLPYWGRRATSWDSTAAAVAKTPGPTTEEAAQLQTELEREDLPVVAALDLAETQLRRYPLWLEFQPQVISWLAQLGATQARDAVRMATAALLTNRPELLTATLAGGVRAMSDQVASLLSDDAQTLRELPAPARLPQVADLRSALGNSQRLVRQAESARERFLSRLEMSEMCRRAGRLDLAVAGLAGLVTEAEHYGLMEWEPALMKRLLRTYLTIGAERESGVSLEVRRRLGVRRSATHSHRARS
jgi:hypothetical protein